MADVALKKIVKQYDRQTVIHSIDAQFNDGEFIVIVGPSGCGKSTILRMIAGLEEISDGEIVIGHEVVNEKEPKDRHIAMVFQNYALYPHMSVFNNMAYGLRLRKHPKAEIERRVTEAAQMLELQHLLGRKPRQLSGGQRQRVAMGRALVRKPEVFLFDEPLSNLDAKLRQQMRVELKKLHRQLKTTMIYVTHDQVEAMTLADRIVVLNNGKIEQMGTPEEIYNQPVSTFVAGFVGSPPMNFIDAGTWLEHGCEQSRTHLNNLAGKYKDRELIVGIRPEKIKIDNQQNSSSAELNVSFVEKLGGGQILYSQIGEDELVVAIRDGEQSDNGTYWASVTPSDIHLFDKDSGKRITQ